MLFRSYQWAFRGNPVEGFRIVNRLMGDDWSLTVDGTATSVQGVADVKNTVLREGDFRWTAHACGDGFSMSLDGQENYYINTHGGPHGFLQVWETANARTDLGSRLIADEVPTAPLSMTPIGDGYYTTLCLPYDVTVGGAKVYILEKGEDEPEGEFLPIIDSAVDANAALVQEYDIPEGYVLLTMVSNTVPAGMPVVLWGESDTATLTYGAGFTPRPSTATGLQGLFLPASPTGALTLQGQDGAPGFFPYEGETLAPNQAVLRLEDGSIQSVKLKFSDVEDGINKIKNEELRIKNEGAYDLQGRKLQGKPTQRGVYINNGRKVLI